MIELGILLVVIGIVLAILATPYAGVVVVLGAVCFIVGLFQNRRIR